MGNGHRAASKLANYAGSDAKCAQLGKRIEGRPLHSFAVLPAVTYRSSQPIFAENVESNRRFQAGFTLA
jgi:hypothetical protein